MRVVALSFWTSVGTFSHISFALCAKSTFQALKRVLSRNQMSWLVTCPIKDNKAPEQQSSEKILLRNLRRKGWRQKGNGSHPKIKSRGNRKGLNSHIYPTVPIFWLSFCWKQNGYGRVLEPKNHPETRRNPAVLSHSSCYTMLNGVIPLNTESFFYFLFFSGMLNSSHFIVEIFDFKFCFVFIFFFGLWGFRKKTFLVVRWWLYLCHW